ncbi:cytochrome P450 6j1-like [Periplaneta americana]|uniref:cytochrome P450 6j1-like n=1 Tax=Periplaneta americana TaxID=6978 RepID=UPI0037E795FA
MEVTLVSIILYPIALLTVILVALYCYMIRNFNFWKKLGIPYLKPIPFVGNLKDTVLQKTNIGLFLKKVYDENQDKPYVGIFCFDQPCLVAVDLELVKNILIKDSHNFIDRAITADEKVDPLIAKSIVLLKGQRWRHVRTKLEPSFSAGKTKKMFEQVEACATQLTRMLEETTADGSPVLLRDATMRYTMDVIASCALGIDGNSLENPDSEYKKYLAGIMDFSIRKGLASLTMFVCPALQSFFKLRFVDEDTTEFLRRLVWTTVEYRQKHGSERNDFLDRLIELMNQEKMDASNGTKTTMDSDDYVAQVFAFLFAGFETSSSIMCFSLYELALHPDIQRRVREEIARVLAPHQNKLTYDNLQELHYLDMVVAETQRKYPILPFLDRRCERDYEIPDPHGSGTIILPAGTAVYIPIIGIQNNPKYFPNPENFDPERFSEENKRIRSNLLHIPFGEGPRICIGKQFGLMQVKTGLVHILSKYEVAPCKDTPIPLILDSRAFSLAAKEKIPMTFIRHT